MLTSSALGTRLSAGIVLLVLGCSASGTNGGPGGRSSGAGAGAGASNLGGDLNIGGSGPNLGGIGQGGGSGGLGGGEECAEAETKAELIQEPVDIIMAIDTSGSMQNEAQAVEDNVNNNFATILANSGVDYRVILIARHREGVRTETGPDSTAICISSPLGGGTCPSANPIFGERFFHFNEKIESETSFDIILSSYTAQDDSTPAALGYAQWLRPGAKKVFLEQTDANPLMSVDAFLGALTAVGGQHFGTVAAPTFVFHSITGLAQKTPATDPYLPDEPIVTELCGDVSNAGETYQDLSKRTGGLRFPICEFAGFDVVFQRIAEDVITKTRVACDFDIPAPPAGKTLDLEKVAVNHTKGDGSGTVQYLQAATSAVCQPDAFYIENNHVYLCPDTCAIVQADTMALVNVVFACESKIIVVQ
jgi:hypothetical protein